MFWEFKDAKNTKNSNEDEGSAASRALAVAFRLLHGQNDEVRNDRDQVEHVHHVLDELQLRRTRRDAQKELDGEPDDADGLDDEERVAIVRPLVVRPAAVGRYVEAERSLECWKRLGAEVGDGDEDADDGDDGEDARCQGAVRLLTE